MIFSINLSGSENYVGKWLNGGRRGHGLNYKCFAQQFVSSPVGPGQRNFFEQTLLLGEVSNFLESSLLNLWTLDLMLLSKNAINTEFENSQVGHPCSEQPIHMIREISF